MAKIIRNERFMETPLVSVIICSYNRKELIGQAIESVLQQKANFAIEIIIGDDYSTDGTRELLLEWQEEHPNIVLNLQEENVLVGANFFSTLKLASGKFVAFLDDDDYWHCNTKLQQQVDFLNENRKFAAVHTNYRNFYIEKNRFEEIVIQNKETNNLQYAIHTQSFRIHYATVLARKDVILNDFEIDKLINKTFSRQDWPLLMILTKNNNIGHIPKSTLTYRKGHLSNSNRKKYDSLHKKFEQQKELYRYFDEINLTTFPFDEQEWDRYINSLLMNLAFRKKDYRKAKNYGKHATKSVKQSCSQNLFLFYGFILSKRLKEIIQ